MSWPDLLDRVRTVCVEAQRRSPSDGLDIPGALAGVHRSLSKAGNSLATTAEAAAMLRLAVGPIPVGAASVRRRAESVFEQVADAERRLAEDAARPAGESLRLVDGGNRQAAIRACSTATSSMTAQESSPMQFRLANRSASVAGVEAFVADPATIGVEVGDVVFVSELVFHKSSVQPGSDNHRSSVPRVAQPEYPLLREHG